MTQDEKFRQSRRLTSLWNFALNQLQDIKVEHDLMIEKLGESLGDMEAFLEEKGINMELCHLANHAEFINEEKLKLFRKRLLDFGNDLKRETDNETTTRIHN